MSLNALADAYTRACARAVAGAHGLAPPPPPPPTTTHPPTITTTTPACAPQQDWLRFLVDQVNAAESAQAASQELKAACAQLKQEKQGLSQLLQVGG